MTAVMDQPTAVTDVERTGYGGSYR